MILASIWSFLACPRQAFQNAPSEECLIVGSFGNGLFSCCILDYDETPWLTIGSRRSKSSSLEHSLQVLLRNLFWLVSSDTSSGLCCFQNVHLFFLLRNAHFESLLPFRALLARLSSRTEIRLSYAKPSLGFFFDRCAFSRYRILPECLSSSRLFLLLPGACLGCLRRSFFLPFVSFLIFLFSFLLFFFCSSAFRCRCLSQL